MAAKTWEEDYRFPAIQSSIRQIGAEPPADLFQFPGSFCLPVGQKPLPGLTPGWIMIVFLVLGFAGLLGGVLIMTVVDKLQGPMAGVVLAVAACTSLSGMAMFFVPLKLDRQIVRWLLGDRGRELVDRARMSHIMAAEVTHADPSAMTLSISGDDYALIFPDEANRRILMEGIGARYQIRAADVERLEPFLFMNYLGVEVVYRVGTDTQL